MDLTPRETADLARFIARRHPTRAELDRIARAARIELDDTLAGGIEAVWSAVIVEAQVQGRTRRLARVLRRQAHPDPRMDELCDLLLQVEPVPASTRLLQASAVVGLLAALAGAALLLHGDARLSPDRAPDREPDREAVTDTPAPSPAEQAAASRTAPATTGATTAPHARSGSASTAADDQTADGAAAAPPPTAPDDQTADGAAAAPPPTAPDDQTADGAAAGSTAPAGREDGQASPAATTSAPRTAGVLPSTPARRGCRGEAGEVVGYWYAGAESPGSAGDTITVPRDVNVRADYPDRHNGYDARAPIRCTLAKGDRVTLGSDPILVPGDRYWVPLVAGGATSSSTSTP